MERALAALERLGVRPLGYRSPSADMSPATLPLLEEHGFLYDSSLMADDFRPYRPRIGDRVTPRAAAAARPRGAPVGAADVLRARRLAALPVRLRAALPRRPLGAEQGARDLDREFDWMHEHVDGGVLTVCMHPQVIGRGHRMAMLERFVEHARGLGAEFARMGDVAQRR